MSNCQLYLRLVIENCPMTGTEISLIIYWKFKQLEHVKIYECVYREKNVYIV